MSFRTNLHCHFNLLAVDGSHYATTAFINQVKSLPTFQTIYFYVFLLTAKPAKVWIVSDIRRRTDLKWFRENYGSKIVTVKVVADEHIRVKRGLVFTKGVDDAPSECDLDGLDKWDYLINNNHSSEHVEDSLDDILNVIKMKITE